MPYHTYASVGGANVIAHFILDERFGTLTRQEDVDVGGSPGSLSISPDRALLYACLRGDQKVMTLAVDRQSGALSKVGEGGLPGGPPYIHVDRSGRWLLAAYYGDNGVSVHAIGADGVVTDQVQWVDTGEHAHSVQTDAGNRFVLVPHTCPTNAMFQFHFDADTGQLSPNDPPKVQPATDEGPRHFVFHPSRDLVYSVNQDGCTVSGYHYDTEAGTLSPFQLISTLPEGTEIGETKTAEIDMTPDGRFLIASNRGHDTLAVFAVGADGMLSYRDCFPTDPVPRFFAIDPSGNWVFAAGSSTGRLLTFRLDPAAGALEQVDSHEVGGNPTWLEFVEQG